MQSLLELNMPSSRREKNSWTLEPLANWLCCEGERWRSYGRKCLWTAGTEPGLSAQMATTFQRCVMTASIAFRATLMTMYAFAVCGLELLLQDKPAASPSCYQQCGARLLSWVSYYNLSLSTWTSHVSDTRSLTSTTSCKILFVRHCERHLTVYAIVKQLCCVGL
jgi:hypothetical protein